MNQDTTRITSAAAVYEDLLDMIGNTPMLELRKLDTGRCQLFAKLELLNPGGSIKDRIGVRMIEQAEQDGLLKPGGTIVEGTAGNTGIALALIGSLKGYTVKVVMPDKMSQEKIDHLRAMGCEVLLTRSDVAKGHPDYYQDVAERIAKETNAFYINQFANFANVAAHYETTGPEIWEQLKGKVDAIVFGVGSGGTLSGCGKYLREKNPGIDIILADPDGSILAPLVKTGETVEPGSWLLEGIGEDFVPDILDLDLVSHAYSITDQDAFLAARDCLKKEGLLMGSSSGCLLEAALRYCKEQTEPKRIVILACDTGNKYLTKMYSDFWMIEQGFIEREKHNDLRDLIARRHVKHEDFTLKPTDTLAVAQNRMKAYAVSQIPITDAGQILGIIDESDMLLAVAKDNNAFSDPIQMHMVTKLETLQPDASIDDLVPIFRSGKVALIADDQSYYGLITQIDMLNYLRRQARQ